MDSFNINVEPQTHNITITKGKPINITVTEEKVVLNKVIEANDINYEGKVIKIDANYPQAIEAARIATEKAEEAKEVVEGFDAHAAEKITEYDANASDKIAAYNANAVEKTDTFNSNATSKTTAFNENASSKTGDFNTNASAKTTEFNDNATSKTNTFNQNATDKTTAFNNNASEKTTAFNDNYTEKKAVIDSQVQLAKDWATKTDGKVDGVDYSSKYWAQQILPIASDITTVAGIASDVTTVSSISSDVTSVASNSTDISTVADSISDVNSVATDILKVTAVADDLTNIDAVNANKTNIDAVAGNNSNITAVANNATNINAVAGDSSAINTVAGISTEVSTVAGIDTDISTVATNISDVSSVATDISNVNAVADDLANINAVNSNKTNIDAVAGDLTNINAVAGDLTNINNASTYADNANIWAEGSDAQVQALGGVHSSKGWAEQSAQGQVQSNWAETDTTAKSYIQNKPTLGTMAAESASDYTKTSGLATVATSGSYADLSNKPTIPTVNNATLTIQKNSTDVATFTANASSNVTANISVPTKVSDLNNDSGFITGITSGDVTTALGYTPYDSSNPSGYTTNVGTVTSVNNTQPDSNGNVSLTIPTVDQTYSASSINAQSGTAVASAISGKANDSDVVKLTGNQSINGVKTFNANSVTKNLYARGNITLGTSTNTWGHMLEFQDTAGKRIARVQPRAVDTTKNSIGMWVNNADNTVEKGIAIYSDGSTEAPTPATSDNSTKIATTAFVKSNLSSKVSTSDLATCHVVVETYVNGTSWYRVYDDGWCEQGGFISSDNSWKTCALLKQYKDTNYNIQISGSGTNSGQGNAPCYVNNSNKTINSFQYTSVSAVNNVYWYACGQGA